MTRKLLIFGGTGFFGQQLIQQALQADYEVISVSRKGQPTKKAAWQKDVIWVAADVFKPEEWHPYLKEVDVLIDAIGIIREVPQKKVTYQRFNVEAAQLLATIGKKAQIPLFVYLSAEPFTHWFLNAYFHSKQAAESHVLENYPQALIVRPSLLVGKERKGTRFALRMSPIIRWFFPRFHPKTVEETAREVLSSIQTALLK